MSDAFRSTAGWIVNDKRVERIWRREGLKVPAKQSKQGRIWFADGSCIRLRAERPNHVWSYDFVEDRTHEGRKYRMLNLIDEFTHKCLAIRVDRKLASLDKVTATENVIYANVTDPPGTPASWTAIRQHPKSSSRPRDRTL